MQKSLSTILREKERSVAIIYPEEKEILYKNDEKFALFCKFQAWKKSEGIKLENRIDEIFYRNADESKFKKRFYSFLFYDVVVYFSYNDLRLSKRKIVSLLKKFIEKSIENGKNR